MRRHPGTDTIDLPNEDEIEAALNAAINLPLGDLLTIEEFAEKYAPPTPVATVDVGPIETIDDGPESLQLPLADSNDAIRALPRAA